MQQKHMGERGSERLHEWLLSHRPEQALGKERRARMLRGALLGSIGYVLASAPLVFSVNPLPYALLAATQGSVGWTLIGVLLGIWQRGAHVALYAAGAVAVVLVRLVMQLFFGFEQDGSGKAVRRAYAARVRQLLFSWHEHQTEQEKSTSLPPLYEQSLSLRVLSALSCGIGLGVGLCVLGGFAYYDLYGALTLVLGMPLMTAVLSPALAANGGVKEGPLPSKKDMDWRMATSAAVLLFSFAFCGRHITFLGLSPVVALVVVLTLVSSWRYGFVCGVCVAVLGGLGYGTLTVPLFVLLALLYCLLSPALGSFALIPAMLSALLYTLLCGGVSMFWALVPSVAVGVLLFTLGAYRHGQEREVTRGAQRQQEQMREVLNQLIGEQQQNEQLISRISRMASAFGSLGEVFMQLSDKMHTPDTYEMRHLCSEVYDGYCPECDKRAACWSQSYEQTAQEIGAIGQALCRGGQAEVGDVPEALRARCPYTDDIVGELNYHLSRRRDNAHWRQGDEIYAQSYDAIACLLRDLLKQENEHAVDPAVAQAIAADLTAQGVNVRHVCVTGERRPCVHLLGLTPTALSISSEQLRALVGAPLGVAMSRPHFDGSEDGRMTLTAQPRLRADYVHRSLAAHQHTVVRGRRAVCGDTLRVFERENGMFYALLCDGMGNGREAALTSGRCAVFLERVLLAGVGVHTALRMLNHYMRARASDVSEERFSTVDLFALDLYTGRGQFIKSGAAPAMIVRQGRLYRLSSHTVPIGILHSIDVQVIPFEVQAGDHILLMSDGVTDTDPDTQQEDEVVSSREAMSDGWLSAYLSGESEALPEDDEALIERLFAMARAHGSADDMSVISVRISDEEYDSAPPSGERH